MQSQGIYCSYYSMSLQAGVNYKSCKANNIVWTPSTRGKYKKLRVNILEKEGKETFEGWTRDKDQRLRLNIIKKEGKEIIKG